MEHLSEGNPEQEEARRALEELPELPEALGYIETEEMQGLRQELIEAMKAGEDIRELALRYRLLAEEFTERVNKSSPGSKDYARLGMLISMALMQRDGGRYEYYLDDLDDALTKADQEGMDDAALVLSDVLSWG